MTPFLYQGDPAEWFSGPRIPPNLADKFALLAFLAEKIPLPGYFGHNWDALEECLGDLRWFKHPRLELIHEDIPLAHLARDQRIYLEILAAAEKKSDRLFVIFPADSRARIAQIMSDQNQDRP